MHGSTITRPLISSRSCSSAVRTTQLRAPHHSPFHPRASPFRQHFRGERHPRWIPGAPAPVRKVAETSHRPAADRRHRCGAPTRCGIVGLLHRQPINTSHPRSARAMVRSAFGQPLRLATRPLAPSPSKRPSSAESRLQFKSLALFFQAFHRSAETPPVTREIRLSSTMSIRLGIESKAARLGCCIEPYRQPTRRRRSSLQGSGRCLPASRSQVIVMGGRGARWNAPIERSDGVACSRPDPTYLSR